MCQVPGEQVLAGESHRLLLGRGDDGLRGEAEGSGGGAAHLLVGGHHAAEEPGSDAGGDKGGATRGLLSSTWFIWVAMPSFFVKVMANWNARWQLYMPVKPVKPSFLAWAMGL